MAIETADLLRRVARNARLVLIVALCMYGVAAAAQLPVQAPVQVEAGSVIPFSHGSTGQWSQIYSVKIAPNGNVLFLDAALSELYQLAPGATEPTLVVGAAPTGQSTNGSTLENSGSFFNENIVFDPNNTMYISDTNGSTVHFYRVPYDATAGTWVFSSAANWTNAPTVINGGVPTAIPSQALAINCDSGFPCTMYASWSNAGEIDKFTVDANGNPGTVVRVVTGLQNNVSALAVDHAGNIYFVEAAFSPAGTKAPGVLEIPVNSTLVGNGTGSLEQTLTRVDLASAGFSFKGLSFDTAGNLYLSSENDKGTYGGYADMLVMVPNEGTPTAPSLSWSNAVMIAPVRSTFGVAIDPRGYIWIPNDLGGSNWAPTGTLATPCTSTNTSTCTTSGVVQWAPGSANLGASPVGTPGTTETVFYSFTNAITPASFAYATRGAKNFTTITTNANPDPTVTPAVQPCTAGTTYPALSGTETTASESSWCAFYVQINPQTAGSVAGELQILDSKNSVVAGSNAYLNGIGQGPAVSALSPAMIQPVALGLQSPKQVAGDSLGNSYVADSTLGTVEMYPPGQTSTVVGTAFGTGLTAPTGVAVDGAGDLYIGDTGKVYEIPFINGALVPAQQTTLQTGLGNHLNLAADAAGNVYVADADDKQIVKVSNPQMGLLLQDQPLNTIGTGIAFTGPSAIATDNSGNIYVADGSNLWELTPSGGQSEITSSLSAPVTGLAVDPSGSVFVAEDNGLNRIPYVASSGGLSVDGVVLVASSLGGSNDSAPFSVALDGLENAYVTYGSGTTAGMAQVGAGGSINYGQIVPFLESDQEEQLFNLGNTPLTLSAFSGDVFTGPNAGDYAVGTPIDSPACVVSTPVTAGQSCYFDVALTPSTAGSSSASVAVLSNAANMPSVSVALAASVVADLRNPTQTVISVSPASGEVYPGTEQVTVTVSSVTSTNGTPTGSVSLILPNIPTQTQPLVNGVATFNYTNLLGGTYNIRAEYGGAGTEGVAPNFSVSAGAASFIIVQAMPAVTISAPTGNSTSVTVFAGNTYVNLASQTSITASVTSSVGTPTGTVTFEQNGQPVDPTQIAIPLNANGTATFSTTNLAQGVYNLTVVYNGDVNYASVTTPTPSFQVIVPSVQITASPSTTTITPGTPDQVTLTLEPLVGFDQQVDVECVTATLPPNSECTFNNPEIGVGDNGTTASTIVMTISTNVPVNGGTTSSSLERSEPWTFAGIFGLGLLGLFAGRKRFSRNLTMMGLALVLVGACIGMTSCTNSGYSTPPPAPVVKTPAGTYQVQVITVNPQTGQQNSLTMPVFTLPTTVN
jgi:hypothetical protein